MDKALTRPFTASQAATVETRLWGLLQRQVQHYTMTESSSVPIEVAQELLKGVNDLIGQGLYGEKDPQEQLLRGDLDQVIQRGLERVNQQVQEGLKLYQYVCAHPPVVTNRAYRETAANILAFFHTYQPQFMPHMIGCTIDYQLFLPVREGVEGIRFLNGYLTHLAAENRLLNCFDRGAVECVLNAASPDYEDLLLNLYQPVFQNALGRCLLGRAVHYSGRTSGAASAPVPPVLQRIAAGGGAGSVGAGSNLPDARPGRLSAPVGGGGAASAPGGAGA